MRKLSAAVRVRPFGLAIAASFLLAAATTALSLTPHLDRAAMTMTDPQPQAASIALPTLTDAPAIRLERAAGAGDEDCVYELPPAGAAADTKKLVCRE